MPCATVNGMLADILEQAHDGRMYYHTAFAWQQPRTSYMQPRAYCTVPGACRSHCQLTGSGCSMVVPSMPTSPASCPFLSGRGAKARADT